MFGVMLSVLWGVWGYASGYSGEEVWLSVTNFLFNWYLVWTFILGAIVVVVMLVAVLGGTAVGAVDGMILGGASFLIAIPFFVRRGLYVGGSYLLSTALVQQGSEWVWSPTALGLGGALLFVALSSSPSSSSSSSD